MDPLTSPGPGSCSLRVALVPWGTPLEVFLDPLGRTLDDFCERLSGGWLFGYADALHRVGHVPTLVVCSRTAQRRTDRVHRATGTPVIVLPPPARPTPSSLGGVRRDLAAYRAALAPGLLRVLAEFDAVLLQEYEEPRTDLLSWWGRRRGVPVLASFQGGAPPWQSAPLQRVVRGPSVRRLAGVLVGSEDEAERVQRAHGLDASRVHRVVNPVDTAVWAPCDRAAARERLGIPAEALVVAWHGRVDVRRKGLDVLVAAWAGVCAARPRADLRLLLTGTGSDDPQLRELLGAPGLRGVAWLQEYARAATVQERLAACDVWVSASRHEGLAVAPLEAMASGRAVVLSAAPGAREVLGGTGAHGGALVPVGSSAAVRDAVLDALDDGDRREERGRAARRRVVDAFSVDAVGRALDAALAAGAGAVAVGRRA